MATTEIPTLKMLLDNRPWLSPLREKKVSSPLFNLEFPEVDIISEYFKPFVREMKYDCGELAIVTYLQAKAYDKDLVLLPVVVSGAFHHKSIAYNAEKGELKPGDLAGKRVGVRSYAQTTGVWVRGVLQNEYGVDLNKVTWVTFEDGHLAEYKDPANCERAPKGKKLVNMLFDRELDAAMLGSDMPKDARLKSLIPDPQADAKAWYDKHGVAPINHMFVIKKSLSKARPDIAREIYRMLIETKNLGPAPATPDMLPYGVEKTRKALEFAINYAYQQKIIPRMMSVDELYDDTTRALG